MDSSAADFTQVDGFDPIIAIVAWGLTWAAKKWAVPEAYQKFLPILAVAFAVFIRAALTTAGSGDVTLDVLLHGAGSGFAAVAGNAQLKSLLKKTSLPEEDHITVPDGEDA